MDQQDPLSRIRNTRAEQKQKSEDKNRHDETIGAILASSKDSKNEVTSAIHDLMLATLVAKDPRLVEVAKNLGSLLEGIKKAAGDVKNSPLDKLPSIHADLVKALKALPEEVAKTDRSPELIPHLEKITKAVLTSRRTTNPTVKVEAPSLDLKPLEKLVAEIKKAVADIKIPKADNDEIKTAIDGTTRAIKSLSFPVANFILPFKDPATGKATQVTLTSDGHVPVDIQDASIAVTLGEIEVKNDTGNPVPVSDASGSLTVDAPAGTPVNVQIGDSTRQATVRDTGASDSLNVAITDASGNQITTFGGGTQYTEADVDSTITGTAVMWEDASDTLRVASAAKPLPVSVTGVSATEYTEDAVAPADPVGGTVMMTRDDQLGTVTEVEGDWSRLRGSSKGALWVTIPDTNGDPITSFGGGTQYTEGDTDATITGTAMLMEGSANALVAATGDATNGLDVDVTRSALPTGAATSAKQDTQQTSLDAIKTATELIDDTVATDDTTTHATGTTKIMGIGAVAVPTDASVNANDIAMPAMTTDRKLHVAVMDALPAGTAAIGKLAPNSGVDIGDVDITSIAAGDNNIGNVDIVTVPADPFGANADAAATAGGTGSIQAKLRNLTSTNDAIKTAVEIIDDWDETDRAKVNSIVGQAGVAAGAGTDSAATQRVTPSTGATSTLTNVADVATSTTLLSAAVTRRKFIMYNDSTSDCYVKYGTTASTTSFTWLVPAGATIEEEHYNGRVDGIWASDASGSMRITEIT